MLISYALLGIVFFLLQNLLIPLIKIRFDLLSLLIFYFSINNPLLSSAILAIFLGVVVDSYTSGPLGLAAGLFLVVVVCAIFLRNHLNLRYAFPQVLGIGLTLILQGGIMIILLNLLEPVDSVNMETIRNFCKEIGLTTLLAPPFYALLSIIERALRKYISFSNPVIHRL
jgi:rod shape-determining protein MreD